MQWITYQDPEYGLSFGAECRKVGTWETVEVCIEVPTYEEDGNTGGQWDPNENTGGGGGGGYQPQSIAPKAKKLFTNHNMSDEEWKKLEDMLDKLTDDCMGGNLYKKLYNSTALNGNFISFRFWKKRKQYMTPVLERSN